MKNLIEGRIEKTHAHITGKVDLNLPIPFPIRSDVQLTFPSTVEDFKSIFHYYLCCKYNKPCSNGAHFNEVMRLCDPVEHCHKIEEGYYFYHDNMIEKICHCIMSNIDIMLIPVHIKTNYNSQPRSNLLIYRRFSKSIELVQPLAEDEVMLTEVIYLKFVTNLNRQLKRQKSHIMLDYRNPIDIFLQKQDLQSLKIFIEKDKWNMFFLELMFMNPDKQIAELKKHVLPNLKSQHQGREFGYLIRITDGRNYLIKTFFEEVIKSLVGEEKYLTLSDHEKTELFKSVNNSNDPTNTNRKYDIMMALINDTKPSLKGGRSSKTKKKNSTLPKKRKTYKIYYNSRNKTYYKRRKPYSQKKKPYSKKRKIMRSKMI